MIIRQSGQQFQPSTHYRTPLRRAATLTDMRKLARAKHVQMAGDDLFHQARTRTRHSNDKDRQLRGSAKSGNSVKNPGVIGLDQTVGGPAEGF